MILADSGVLIAAANANDPPPRRDFLDGFAAGALMLASLAPTDLSRMAELIRQYPNLNLDSADASIVALAERLRLDTVATIDRRDFTTIRPQHLPAFTLLPEQP